MLFDLHRKQKVLERWQLLADECSNISATRWDTRDNTAVVSRPFQVLPQLCEVTPKIKAPGAGRDQKPEDLLAELNHVLEMWPKRLLQISHRKPSIATAEKLSCVKNERWLKWFKLLDKETKKQKIKTVFPAF